MNDRTRQVATTPELRCDPKRIAERIEEFARISEPGTGVTRVGYSGLERQAHALFAEQMAGYGCEVSVDPAGNTIATRPGRRVGTPAIGTGSHLDSVHAGGRYDGIVGVVAAMETARLLHAGRVETDRPLRFVVFACEEGARFGQACLGSKLAAGLASPQELTDRVDRDGVSVADAMRQVDLDPGRAAQQPWDPTEWAAFVELHIEQGSVLERDQVPVGIVDLISGSTRLEIAMRGRASHTGGTPMVGRSDALAAAAETILLAEQLAMDSRHRGTRATVGRMNVSPGSITTIPGEVRLTVDIRDIDADRQRVTAAELVRRTRAVCDRRRVQMDVSLLGDTSPVVLPVWTRQVIADTARDLDVGYRVLTSGASHDAQMVNRLTPTAMIFVPSAGGLSHVPDEWTSPVDVATGVRLLGTALLALDRKLAELEHPATGARS